jgi:hypothetical protein
MFQRWVVPMCLLVCALVNLGLTIKVFGHDVSFARSMGPVIATITSFGAGAAAVMNALGKMTDLEFARAAGSAVVFMTLALVFAFAK